MICSRSSVGRPQILLESGGTQAVAALLSWLRTEPGLAPSHALYMSLLSFKSTSDAMLVDQQLDLVRPKPCYSIIFFGVTQGRFFEERVCLRAVISNTARNE